MAARCAADVLVIDVDGLVAVTAPWVPAEACIWCGQPTRCRFHVYGSDPPLMYAVHALCLREGKRVLVDAA